MMGIAARRVPALLTLLLAACGGGDDAGPVPPVDVPVQPTIDVLAAVGIATYEDDSFTVVAPATGTEVLGLTRFQVTNLAREAALGGGLSAATLNGMAEPVVLELPDQQLVVPLSLFVAAYVAAVDSPGAAHARGLMGEVDPARHAELRYPTVVVATFFAEALQPAASTAPAGPPRVRRDPCAAAQGLLNAIPMLMAQLVVPSGGGGFWGAVAGAIVSTVVNVTVDAALTAIRAALSQIRVALAGAAAAVYTASLLRSWNLVVQASPMAFHYAIQGMADPGGKFEATVAGGAGVDYPQWVESCASLFGVALPQTQRAEGSTIRWTPAFASHARPGSAIDMTIGPGDRASYAFTKSTETSADHAANEEKTGTIAMTAVVSRQVDPTQIRNFISGVFAGVPDVLAALAGSGISQAVGQLADVSGTTSASVTHHRGEHATIEHVDGPGRLFAYSCSGAIGTWNLTMMDPTYSASTQWTFTESMRTVPVQFTYTANYGGDPPYIETFVNDWQVSLVDGDSAIDISGTTTWADGQAVQDLDQDPGWQAILPFPITMSTVSECAGP